MASAGILCAADWPQLQGNPQRTGYTTEEVPPPYRRVWELPVQPDRLSRCHQPIVYRGRCFFGTKKGVVHSVEIRSGKVLWQTPLGGGIFQTLGAEGAHVFANSLDGFVYALRTEDGGTAWKHDTGFPISAGVLLADGRLFAANRQGRVVALSQSDGRLLWEAVLGAPCLMTPSYHDGRVYVGAEDLRLRALDAATGRVLWLGPQLFGESFSPYYPMVHAGQVFVRTKPTVETIAAHGGGFNYVAFRDGNPLALRDGTLFVDEAAQQKLIERYRERPYLQGLYALDEQTGEQSRILWHMADNYCLGSGTVIPPAVDRDGMLIEACLFRGAGQPYAGSNFGRLDPRTGLIAAALPRQKIGGNPDETVGSSCGGRYVVISHMTVRHGAFTDGVVDLDTGTEYAEPWEGNCRYVNWTYANNNAIAINPAVMADGMIFRQYNECVGAWIPQGDNGGSR